MPEPLTLVSPTSTSLPLAELPERRANIVYFDLETKKTFDEVGGRTPEHKRQMEMSVGVTYSTATGEYVVYNEKTVSELVRTLMRADLVVGFNIVNFDYDVLSAYTMLDMKQVPTLDMLEHVAQCLGHRLKLDVLAKATLGASKTADGLDAILWWRQGEILKIAEYCCYDVKVTKLLYEYGVENQVLWYTDKFGQRRPCKVNWPRL
ncbi:MAG: ribonuclease H-like domain-containing protein [Verrucomicrobiae bacterium]|nr:ribonuclease H-like domain-containing protein [Verrucomicrobiae bacterium]